MVAVVALAEVATEPAEAPAI